MKANRKFVQADDAVSPVIAVILMVAITVVLAATVFVLVSDIGSNTGQSAPAFSATVDEGTDQLSISSAAANANWNRLTIKGSEAGASFNLNEDSNLDGGTAPVAITTAGVDVSGDNVMSAGEYLDFCGTATDVTITLIDATANQVMGDWLISSLAACGT